ncbi:hypothetical protein GCM10023314_30410 [Algibacter agarivorans]|uniref:Transposase n=1 Tax=Algibacter agarivorans TaxID=1109741 RepID=A0ABP9GWF5_9FLAO
MVSIDSNTYGVLKNGSLRRQILKFSSCFFKAFDIFRHKKAFENLKGFLLRFHVIYNNQILNTYW